MSPLIFAIHPIRLRWTTGLSECSCVRLCLRVLVCTISSKITNTLSELMDHSRRLSLFCRKWSIHCKAVEKFARSLFIWRKPAPKFHRSKVATAANLFPFAQVKKWHCCYNLNVYNCCR